MTAAQAGERMNPGGRAHTHARETRGTHGHTPDAPECVEAEAPAGTRHAHGPEAAHGSVHPATRRPVARVIPVFRANPYPEVTDLICRLPLPTLIYRLETLNLGDLLRIRYKLLRVCVPQSSIFKVQEENIDTAI